MQKMVGAASCLSVGAISGAVVGLIAARLSHVSTFIVAGQDIADGPRRAVEYRRSAQSMVTLGVSYGIAAALVVLAVALFLRVRLVRGVAAPGKGHMLGALSLGAGVVLGVAAVVLAHFASYTAAVHAGRVNLVRPDWLPSLPLAVGIGAVLGVVGGRLLRLANVGLVSSRAGRTQDVATPA